MVLLFSLPFFTLLQPARRSQVIFIQRLITRRAQTRDEKLRYSVNLLLLNWRKSALAYTCVGSSKASVTVWKPGQFKCSEHVLERTFGLQGKHSILFTRLLLLLSCSCYLLIIILWHTQATKATKDLDFDVFQGKRDAIKSNLSSACLPKSINWLTALGFQLLVFTVTQRKNKIKTIK